MHGLLERKSFRDQQTQMLEECVCVASAAETELPVGEILIYVPETLLSARGIGS